MGLKARTKDWVSSLRLFLGSLRAAALEGDPLALALEALGGDETLDFGGLGVFLSVLAGNGAADDEFSHIILLVQTEEFADLGGTLGAESLRVDDICEAGEFAFTLLDDAEGHDAEVEVGNGWKL